MTWVFKLVGYPFLIFYLVDAAFDKALSERIVQETANAELTPLEKSELADLRFSIYDESFDMDVTAGADKNTYDEIVQIMVEYGLDDIQKRMLLLGKNAAKKEKKIQSFDFDNGKGKAVYGIFSSIQTSEGVYDIGYAVCNIKYAVKNIHGRPIYGPALMKYNKLTAYQLFSDELKL